LIKASKAAPVGGLFYKNVTSGPSTLEHDPVAVARDAKMP